MQLSSIFYLSSVLLSLLSFFSVLLPALLPSHKSRVTASTCNVDGKERPTSAPGVQDLSPLQCCDN